MDFYTHTVCLFYMFILPSVYMGNIFYWQHIAKGESLCIDEAEYFVKQTFRNRAEIGSEKGRTDLIVPLEKGKNSKQAMYDVCISYAENWQAQHIKTLFSAYGKAAYFEHYKPELEILFSYSPRHLCEWNRHWFDFFSHEFELDTKHISYANEYQESTETDIDLRDKMSPKIHTEIEHLPYYHLFFDKFPQPQNLSVIDVLMNEGPRGRALFL